MPFYLRSWCRCIFAMIPLMCGRYSITVDKSAIEYHFNARFSSGQFNFEPTYNTAPSQRLGKKGCKIRVKIIETTVLKVTLGSWCSA